MSTYGPDFDERADGSRIRRQHEVIRDLMLMADAWWTLAEIAGYTGYPESSVSAQLRHLRKPQFGSFRVDKRRRGDAGTWEYHVEERVPQFAQKELF